MKGSYIAFLTALIMSFDAVASNEGVPAYYQKMSGANANQIGYNAYQNQGYTHYVGQSGNKQIVGSRSYTYQIPRQQMPNAANGSFGGIMTPNGIAMPVETESATTITAQYTRRFADFSFKSSVNSILEWDDMIFNEIGVKAQHNFNLRNFDLFAYGEYAYGKFESGGLSMDYDLEPYDWAYPDIGIFTISMGNQTGNTSRLRLGFGARHIWDVAGWKLSPTIGYEIFKHNLEMSNHIYPNQAVYLPLMTSGGDYVYGDEEGNYFALPINVVPDPNLYQVCMSPEDIKVVPLESTGGYIGLGETITTVDWNSTMGELPWGVAGGECVIIGGDGPVRVDGTTHIYNTTWSGLYFGLEIEKQMTLNDKLRFYVQVGMPKYSSEGTWPNRTDWQQNPSFLDEGSNGSYSYSAEMEYNYRLSDRVQLSLKVDTNMYHVGKVGGELYVAEYSTFQVDEYGQYVYDIITNSAGQEIYVPVLVTVPAHTEKYEDQLKYANWQSFGISLGVKYAF